MRTVENWKSFWAVVSVRCWLGLQAEVSEAFEDTVGAISEGWSVRLSAGSWKSLHEKEGWTMPRPRST